MNRHRTDKQLIESLFGLAPELEAHETRLHLDACLECRRRLDELKAGFARLDLLRGPADASAALLQATIERVRTAGGRERIPAIPPRVWWLAGAAAAAAAALIVFTLPGRVTPVPEERPLIRVAEKPPQPAGADIEKLRAQPPFPPASAIELNVLPRREKVQLTIYNSADLTLVRERRNLTMKQGWNWMQYSWANTLIDPTSLDLEPLEHRDEITIEQLTYPPRLKDLGRWLIFSKISGEVPFEITYLTSGLSWRAFYMGTLAADERTMQLEGHVRVANRSGEDYEDARTRVIVGKAHVLDEIAALAKQQYPFGRPGAMKVGDRDVNGLVKLESGKLKAGAVSKDLFLSDGTDADARKAIVKEGLSEYFLYTIEGTERIPNGWDKRLPSLDTNGIPVVSLYKYDEERWGERLIGFVAFANDEEHKLGQTPLPDGRISIYRMADAEGHLSYAGGADVKYIPIGEKVELNLGEEPRVSVEPKLMELRSEKHEFDGRGNVAGWEEVRKWRIGVRNTRGIPVRVEITRGFGTAYWAMEGADGAAHEKHDATHARFNLELAAGGKTAVNYTVRTFCGTREQSAK
jgi:hypothetical protein